MTVNRTTLLDLPLPVTGTESNTWGDITNNGLTEYMDIAIAGMSNLTSANFTAGALTIETTEGNAAGTSISATSAQYAGFRVTSLAANSTITVGNTGTSPARSYRLINADSTYNLTFKATGQTGVTLLPGQSAVVAFNGTDYVIVGTVGAGTATDNAIARFDGTTGEILQNSAATIDDTGAATFVGSVNVSGTSASGADLKLYEDTDNGTNYVAFKSPASVASNVTWTLPSADGTNGQALTTNGSGTLAFSSVTTSPGGSTTQVQYNNAGAFAGSANFVFDGTNVGIGASSPADRLDVRQAGVAARFTSTNGNANQVGFSNSATAVVGFYMGSPAADVLQFSSSAGTERMRIDSSGNVGIGTSSISNKLEVNGSARFYTAAQGDISITHSGLISSITAAGSVGLALGTNNAERMRITSAGNVGIGTTSPSTKLDIVGPSTGSALADAVRISTSIGFGASYGDGLSFYNSNPSYLAQLAGIYPYTSGFSQKAGNLIFATNNGTTYAERMRIDHSGNVGIGVTPSYRFDVSGASASGIARFANAWGDGTNPAILVDGTGSDGRLVQIKSGGTRSWPLLWVTASTTDVLVVNGDSTIKTAGTISVGGATPSTSGAGITFPATQSASSDANTLDDYEEGTWTPTYTASTPGTISVSYGSQTGRYTKIGRVVCASFALSATFTKGTASGDFLVGGLPFTSANITDEEGGAVTYSNNTFPSNVNSLLNFGNSTSLYVILTNGSSVGISTLSDSTTYVLRGMVTYTV